MSLSRKHKLPKTAERAFKRLKVSKDALVIHSQSLNDFLTDGSSEDTGNEIIAKESGEAWLNRLIADQETKEIASEEEIELFDDSKSKEKNEFFDDNQNSPRNDSQLFSEMFNNDNNAQLAIEENAIHSKLEKQKIEQENDQFWKETIAKQKKELKNDRTNKESNEKDSKAFVFPSYRSLLKEKSEPPNLQSLKLRIESVLEILSNLNELRDQIHSRKQYISLLSHALSRYYGYNLDLMNMFLAIFNPNECLAFLESNEMQRPLTIRCNSLKCRRRDLAKMLIERGINLDPLSSWTKTGLKILNTGGIPLGATPEYLSGYYIIQSAASLLPVLAMNIKGGQKILDMCCAPGGKTTHIAQILRNTGMVVANDISTQRLKAVFGNCHRMSLTSNIIMINMDGRQLCTKYHAIFDRVLLDAPCSCLGVISRDNSIKYRKTFADVNKMSTLQKELMLSAIDLCKVGGYVVYSTCSVSPYENESVVQHGINKRYVKIVDCGLEFGVNGFTKFQHLKFDINMKLAKRYYPHIHNLDGFFIAKLYKFQKGGKDWKSKRKMNVRFSVHELENMGNANSNDVQIESLRLQLKSGGGSVSNRLKRKKIKKNETSALPRRKWKKL